MTKQKLLVVCAALGMGAQLLVGALPLNQERISSLPRPKLVKQVNPVYPPQLREQGVFGVVVVEALADETGHVAEATALAKDNPHPLLAQAAVDAVKQWVYEPWKVDGKPAPVRFVVQVAFSLDDKPVRVAQEKRPRSVRIKNPEYPRTAMKERRQGTIQLEVVVGKDGTVQKVRVLEPAAERADLEQAAVDAVKQWVYEPWLKDGKPCPVIFNVKVSFALH